jgi:hypothetical protein
MSICRLVDFYIRFVMPCILNLPPRYFSQYSVFPETHSEQAILYTEPLIITRVLNIHYSMANAVVNRARIGGKKLPNIRPERSQNSNEAYDGGHRSWATKSVPESATLSESPVHSKEIDPAVEDDDGIEDEAVEDEVSEGVNMEDERLQEDDDVGDDDVMEDDNDDNIEDEVDVQDGSFPV